MIKNAQTTPIQLGYGIHRSPSFGNDGELSEAVNLIPRKGELVNIQPPVETNVLLSSSEKLLAIHSVLDEKHFIVLREYTSNGNTTVNETYITATIEDGAMVFTLNKVCEKDVNISLVWENDEVPSFANLTIEAGQSNVSYSGDHANEIPLSAAGYIENEVGEYFTVQVYMPGDEIEEESEETYNYELAYFTKENTDRTPIYYTNKNDAKITCTGNIIHVSLENDNLLFLWTNSAYKKIEDTSYKLGMVFGLDPVTRSVEKADTLRLQKRDGSTNPSARTELLTSSQIKSGYLAEIQWNFIQGKKYRIRVINYGGGTAVNINVQLNTDGDYPVLTLTTGNSKPYWSEGYDFVYQGGGYNRVSVMFVIPYQNGWTNASRNSFTVNLYEVTDVPEESVGDYYIEHLEKDDGKWDYDDMLAGGANEAIKDWQKTENHKGRFVLPFLVRYGLRLKTGQIVGVSPSILMEPNSGVFPCVGINENSITWNNSYYLASVTYFGFACKLMYQVQNEKELENLMELYHSDVVSSLVIAVSDPIYRYKEYATWDDFDKLILTKNKPDNKCYAKDGVKQISTNLDYYLELPSYDKTYEDLIAEKTDFTIIKEIEISDLKAGAFTDCDITEDDLAKISASVSKISDPKNNVYAHTSKGCFSYNDRLIQYGVTDRISADINIDQMCGFVSAKETRLNVEVVFEKEGKKFSLFSGILTSRSSNRRWFYINDYTAKEVIEHYPDGSKKMFRLKRHKLLNGAYHFGAASDYDKGENKFNEQKGAYYISYGREILVSAINNPTVVDEKNGRYALNCGDILGISTAAKALSQGQFGQFPLYIFATDGIWALSLDEEGRFVANQPVSRDVVTDPSTITQIDGGVVFATKQGLKLLSGSDVTLISKDLDGHNISEDLIKTHLQAFADKLGKDSPLVEDTELFVNRAEHAKIAYDYAHHLLHVFPEGEHWHYVYDFETAQWATQLLDASVKAIVPGYPLTTIQFNNAHDGSAEPLITYDTLVSHDKRIGYILTRQLVLGNALAKKMLIDLRTIGQKNTDDSIRRVAVLISNDGVKWATLTSLKKMSAKYYRFLVMTYMEDNETLSGIVAQYVERFNNKLR